MGAVLAACATVLVTPAAGEAFPDTPYPQIALDHVMSTMPFAGSSVSVNDNEGSAYVPRDNSFWMADDDGRKLYEVDPSTGALKRTIGATELEAVSQLGGGPQAGTWRVRDLESISYDAAHDVLYAFSGKCCVAQELPTVFRLTRDASGVLQLDSYQALPDGSDFTGSAWNPGDGNVYVGNGPDLRTYDYVSNVAGPTFQVPKLSRITGLEFSADGQDLWATHSLTKVSRIDWATKALVPGWSFDLSSFGVMDARAVEIINDRLWVSDGYDFRDGDPLGHAVFVFAINPPPPDFNIVGNPGFETDTDGWNNNHTSGIVLDRAPTAHSGAYAARLTNTNATATTMTLNDAPNWVGATQAGTYTAKVWVRSDTGTQKAFLRWREYDGQVKMQELSTYVLLSPSWQQITIPVTPQAPGSSTLDLTVYVSGAVAKTNLYVDDVVVNYQ